MSELFGKLEHEPMQLAGIDFSISYAHSVPEHRHVPFGALAEHDHDLAVDVADVVGGHHGDERVGRLGQFESVADQASGDRILQQARRCDHSHPDDRCHVRSVVQ